MVSKIEWTDKTWNPVTGCTKVSEGCRNCYAEKMAKRLAGRYGYPDAPKHFDVTEHRDKLWEPQHWLRLRMIFVCSMGDLFHENVALDTIDTVVCTMSVTPEHTYQILTKRPERMREYFRQKPARQRYPDIPLSNVWLGVSVENQEAADERIPILLDTPAAVRFVSVEPMLGPVDLFGQGYLGDFESKGPPFEKWSYVKGLDWVIAGCESGPKRRPCDIDWIRDVRDQCVSVDVPFFLKQMDIDGKVVKMPALDGKVWDQMPEVSGELGEQDVRPGLRR